MKRVLLSFLVVSSFALAESRPAGQTTIVARDNFTSRAGAPWKPEFITKFYSMNQDAPVSQALAAQCNAKYPVASPDWNLWRRIGCAATISYREVRRKIYNTPPKSNDREFPCQRYERGFNFVITGIAKPKNVSWSVGAIGLRGTSTRDGHTFAHVLNRLTIWVSEYRDRELPPERSLRRDEGLPDSGHQRRLVEESSRRSRIVIK